MKNNDITCFPSPQVLGCKNTKYAPDSFVLQYLFRMSSEVCDFNIHPLFDLKSQRSLFSHVYRHQSWSTSPLRLYFFLNLWPYNFLAFQCTFHHSIIICPRAIERIHPISPAYSTSNSRPPHRHGSSVTKINISSIPPRPLLPPLQRKAQLQC
jgi:hypothetical protein